MRYASCEQTERREFLGLDKLFLKADPLRNVVHQDQTPDPVSGFPTSGAIDTLTTRFRPPRFRHGKLVQAGDAFLAGSGRNFSRQIGREHFVEFSADGLVTAALQSNARSVCSKTQSPPWRSIASTTHVERFDDVFREVFQPLNLDRFCSERSIELGIVESDGQITGDCQQKFRRLRVERKSPSTVFPGRARRRCGRESGRE